MMTKDEERYLQEHGSHIEDKVSNALSYAIHMQDPDPVRCIGTCLLGGATPAASQSVEALAASKGPDGLVSLDDQWSPTSWLQNAVDLPALILRSLSVTESAGVAARDAICALDTPGKFHELLQRNGFFKELSSLLAEAAAGLRSESLAHASPSGGSASGGKFSEGAETLVYGPINLFFSGLEGLVGAPHPMVQHGMKSEHCTAVDSDEEFVTSNYKTRTTSKIEWHFVAEPNDETFLASISGKWPADDTPPRCADGNLYERSPDPPSKFADKLREVNDELKEAGEPEMLMEELIGCRLYTGPMFVKYNTVLRGLGTRAARNAEEQASAHEKRSGRDSVEMRRFASNENSGHASLSSIEVLCEKLCKGNKYTTTLHLINSAIIKLSKNTKVSKVYRGLSGRALPASMVELNKFDTRGGVEFAFLSTSTERSVADQYSSNGSIGLIFEIAQGLTDRGASISWLSQYSLEAEVLFPPLSALEVIAWRQEGQKMVFELRLSVNLTSEPIQRVIAKFKNANQNLLKVLRSDLHSGGAPQLSLLSLDGLIQTIDARDHSWFNVLENYQKATKDAFKHYRDALKLLSVEDMWKTTEPPEARWKKMRKILTISAGGGEHDAAIDILKTLHKQCKEAGDFLLTFPARRASPAETSATRARAVQALQQASPYVEAVAAEAPGDVWRVEVAAALLAEGARPPFGATLVHLVGEGSDHSRQSLARAFAALVAALFTEPAISKGRTVLVLLVGGDEPPKKPVQDRRWKEGEVVREAAEGKVGVRVGDEEKDAWETLVLPFDGEGAGRGALLREAAAAGEEELVKALLEHGGVHVREADNEANTALHMATAGGHENVCGLLLKHGANMMLRNRRGKRPLDNSFQNHRSNLLRTNQPSAADKDFRDKRIPAVEAMDPSTASPLRATRTSRKLSRLPSNLSSLQPLHILAAAFKGSESQLQEALSRDDNPNCVDEASLLTPLMLCARDAERGAGKARLLLRHKAKIELQSKSGCTALAIAAEAGNETVVSILLEADVERVNSEDSDSGPPSSTVDLFDETGATPLMHAAFNGHAEVAELLLTFGAKHDLKTHAGPKNDQDFTPLHRASLHGHHAVVKVLLQSGADVTLSKSDGYHALLFACLQGQIDVAREIINSDEGKTVNQKNKTNLSSLMVACKNDHAPTVRLLLQARANINDKDDDMMTALLYACEAGAEDCVEILVKEGADCNAPKQNGQTPLAIAEDGGYQHAIAVISDAIRRGP